MCFPANHFGITMRLLVPVKVVSAYNEKLQLIMTIILYNFPCASLTKGKVTEIQFCAVHLFLGQSVIFPQ